MDARCKMKNYIILQNRYIISGRKKLVEKLVKLANVIRVPLPLSTESTPLHNKLGNELKLGSSSYSEFCVLDIVRNKVLRETTTIVIFSE